MAEVLDWNKLPTKLAYLISPAMKYGHYQFEDKIFDFLRVMSESQRTELEAISRRAIMDEREIDSWIDLHPITKHPEARLIYFLEHMLALGNDAGFFSK